MIRTILIVVAALDAAVLIVAATRPDDFRVERSTTIKAPASKIFPLINDLHQWALWSLREKIDPSMKRSFTGASSGVGATYAWA